MVAAASAGGALSAWAGEEKRRRNMLSRMATLDIMT